MALAGLLLAHSLVARDADVGQFHWVYPTDAGGELPAWSRTPRLRVPPSLEKSTAIAYRIVPLYVSAESRTAAATSIPADPEFVKDLDAGLKRARIASARRDGKPADAHVWFAAIFDPAGGEAGASSLPRLIDVAPAFVPSLSRPVRGESSDAIAVIRVGPEGSHQLLSFEGRPLSAPETEAAKAAVAQWRFSPAIRSGKPTSATVKLPVVFLANGEDDPLDWPPQPRVVVQPKRPASVPRDLQRGRVIIGFDVEPDGSAGGIKVMASSSSIFDDPAVESLRHSSFLPARRRGSPVRAHMTMEVSFRFSEDRRRGQKMDTGMELLRGSVQDSQAGYDVTAKPKAVARPIYPFALLANRTSGSARVVFEVSPAGRVVETRVESATVPDFGQAVIAMLDTSEFEPAQRDGNPVASVLMIEQRFDPATGGDARLDKGVLDLLAAERSGHRRIVELNQLDAALKPVSRRPPVYPSALRNSGESGEALIEFLVDESGQVQLPRIIKASSDAFGFAAVQAISDWRFSVPTKDGKPVVARARVPVQFKTPAASGD